MKVIFASLALIIVSSSAFANCVPATSAQFIDAALKSVPQSQSITSVSVKNQTTSSASVSIQLGNPSKVVALKVQQNCSTNQLVASADPNPNQYVCQTGYVNCMPRGGDGGPQGPDYCSDDFQTWSMANCGGVPPMVD